MSIYYRDEFVTLYHGDCLTEHREWLTADVLVTDPPYGISWTQRTGDPKDRGTKVAHNKGVIANDRETAARDSALAAWGRRPYIAFGSWKAERPKGIKTRLIWHKTGSNPGPLNAAFMSNDEEIYISGDGFRKSSPPLRSVITTHESRAAEVRKIGHPTPKPVGLMELLVDRCPPGVIADPFAGSGATLVAAKNLGREVIGVELEEKYCEVIAKRCAQDVLDFSA
jgi:site-specific DNA-methyltransferase (adenine-specific)